MKLRRNLAACLIVISSISPLARAQKNLNQNQVKDLSAYIEQAEANELELKLLKDKYQQCTAQCLNQGVEAGPILLAITVSFFAGFGFYQLMGK